MNPVLRAYREAFADLPRAVWMLAAVSLVNRAGSMVLVFLAIYATEVRGLTDAGAGRILAAYGIGSALGVTLGGRLADRFRPRLVMVISLISAGFSLLLIPRTTSGIGLLAAVLVSGIATESFRPANSTELARACPPALLGRAFGLMRLAINLGLSLGPALGGWLAERSFAYLFAADSFTCALAAAFALWVLRDARRDALNESPPSPDAPREAAVSPWRDGPFLLVATGLFLSSIVFFQLFSTWPLYHRDVLGFSKTFIGVLLAVNTALVVVFEMLLVHRVRHVSALRSVAFGVFCVGIGFAILPFGSGAIFAIASVAVWTLGEMLIGPRAAEWVTLRAPRAKMGRYLGVFNLSFALAQIVGPALGTLAAVRFGWTYHWLGCGVLSLLSMTLFSITDRRGQRSNERAARMPP